MLRYQGKIMRLPSYNKISRIASYTTFWGWNVTFLLLAVFGIMPWVGLAVTTAVLSGELSLDFLISMWLLVLVPAISAWIAAKKVSRTTSVTNSSFLWGRGSYFSSVSGAFVCASRINLG